MLSKTKLYIIAFGVAFLICMLFCWGFGANRIGSKEQSDSESLQENPVSNFSKDDELTEEKALKFLEDNRSKLLSKDARKRQQAVYMILEERKKNISILIGHILQDDRMYRENPDIVVAAIRLIGQLRADKAVDVLAENLDFKAPGSYIPSPLPNVLNGREAVFALIQIGKPSVPSVIREVLREENYIKLACAACVIERVEGKEVGAFYLQKLIEKETDKKKQATLRKLKEFVQKGTAKL